jgi:hypothetical protein
MGEITIRRRPHSYRIEAGTLPFHELIEVAFLQQTVQLLVEGAVIGLVIVPEVLEGIARGPAVESQIAAGMVEIADRLCAEVFRNAAEEAGPVAIGAVDSFEGTDGIRGDVKFPDDQIAGRVHTVAGSESMLARQWVARTGRFLVCSANGKEPSRSVWYNPSLSVNGKR